MPGQTGRDLKVARKEGSVVLGHLLGKGYVIAVRVRVIQILAVTDNRRSVAAAATPTNLRLHLHLSRTTLQAKTKLQLPFGVRLLIDNFWKITKLYYLIFSNYYTTIGRHFDDPDGLMISTVGA